MKKKEFNTTLKSITTNEMLDVVKIALLDNTVRSNLVHYIVRYRGPIVKDLIPPGFDLSWLYSMGYMYETKGKDYTFVHTVEHRIK